MSEISNTIYVFKKVMKQLMALKKHEAIAKKNTEKIKKGVNVNEIINININENQENQENKKVKTLRNTPWVCDCGANLLWGGKKLHLTTKKHFTNMKNKEELPVCVIIQEAILIPKIQNIIEVIPEIVVPKKVIKKVFKIVVKPIE